MQKIMIFRLSDPAFPIDISYTSKNNRPKAADITACDVRGFPFALPLYSHPYFRLMIRGS